MSSKYDDLIRFIPAIKDDNFGKWIVDHENNGTLEHPIQFPFVNYSACVRELEHAIYKFDENNPDMGILRQEGHALAHPSRPWLCPHLH